MANGLVLVAAGGLALEAAEAAIAAGIDVAGCVDDDPTRWGTTAGGWLPVLGGVEDVVVSDAPLLLCAGKGAVRERLAARLAAAGVDPARYARVVHPSVAVPRSCAVGAGTVLLAGVVLTASVTVGSHVVAMPRVTLTHDDVIEDFATLCAGVTLGGGVRVGRSAYLGMSSSVRERVTVGPDAMLGMGAVVTRDVPAGETWVGVPARRMVSD